VSVIISLDKFVWANAPNTTEKATMAINILLILTDLYNLN